MIFDPPEFGYVSIDRFERHTLTPRPPDRSFMGLLIAAPLRVLYAPGEQPRVPVCGFARMDAPSTPVLGAMRLLARDERGLERAGPITRRSPHLEAEPPPPPRVDPELLRGLVITESFNPDAVATCELPTRPGRYALRVEHRGFISNELEVEVAEAPT